MTAQLKAVYWWDVNVGEIPRGEYVHLERPSGACQGWDDGRRERLQYCNGGRGLWITRRARWVKWDGTLQCGECHRLDWSTHKSTGREPNGV